MPKQAERSSVPVFLQGTALAKSPNDFVTSNIFPSRFDASTVHACKTFNAQAIYFCLPLMSHSNSEINAPHASRGLMELFVSTGLNVDGIDFKF